jgi:hypothetical protein
MHLKKYGRLSPSLVTGLAALLLCAFAPLAQAGRPLQSEDAGVLNRADCEIEGAQLRTTTAGQRETETGLVLGCGLGWKSQLGLGFARTRAEGESAKSAQLGGKTGLWRGAGDDAAAVTLAWALGYSREAGKGWLQTEQTANLVATLPADPVSVHLNLGRTRDRQSRVATTTWGLAVEHEGTKLGPVTWAPMLEIFGDDRDSPWLNAALRVTVLPERFFLDLSVGQKLGGDKARLLTAGFKLAF